MATPLIADRTGLGQTMAETDTDSASMASKSARNRYEAAMELQGREE